MGPVPNIIMLTADAFGILPPIAKLTPDQAMYHFLSGYTAKVAGTEIGVTEPEATFSTCFGAPFMPRHPSVYGNLLKERIAKGGVDAGWSTPAGPAASTASASACRSRRPARCSTPRSTAA
jgi:phosphoenolpyruvate carboxykinase (ATP)